MCSFYPIVILLSILMYYKIKNSKIDQGLILSYFTGRLLFVVIAPVIGVSIYQILDKNSDNLNAIVDYKVVSSCMDQYSQLNFSELTENLNK